MPNDVFQILTQAALYKTTPDKGLYDALGNLILSLSGVQIETGNYTGNNTYGQRYPNSLTFAFPPKLVFIVGDTDGIVCVGIIFPNARGMSIRGGTLENSNTPSSSMLQPSLSGNTVSWYNSYSEIMQLNDNKGTYYYAGLGY